jgi:peptide/nickel transport system permease protein
MPAKAALSPSARAWQHLRRNPLFWIGGVVVLWVLLACGIGPWLANDTSPNANRQILELAKLPPGTSCAVLVVSHTGADTSQSGTPSYYALAVTYSPNNAYTPLHRTVHPAAGAPRVQEGYVLRNLDTLWLDANSAQTAPLQVQYLTFWLGTDTFGRDILSRLLLGGRVSLWVGLLAVVLSISVGACVGLVAGWFGGRTDAILQWGMTVLWSIPSMLLAIALAFVLGRGLLTVSVAIGLTTWVELARVVRGQVLALREREFLTATQTLGYGTRRVLFRHLLPNLWGTVLILGVSNFSAAVMLEAGLSFLGLGAQSPTPSWGGMVHEGYQYLLLSNGKWLAVFPGVAMLGLVVGLNLLSLAIKDALQARN